MFGRVCKRVFLEYIYIYIEREREREGIPSGLSGGFEVTVFREGQIVGQDTEIGVSLAGYIRYMQYLIWAC